MASTTAYGPIYGPDQVAEHLETSAAYESKGHITTGLSYDSVAGEQAHHTSFWTTLAWWIPELIASILSIAALLAVVGVLRSYDNRPLADLDSPKCLTLNGVIAILATFNRAFVMAVTGSSILQDCWLHLAHEARNGDGCRSRLRDLSLFADASRGALGSLFFFFHHPRR
jgi:hypothetical protein